MTEKDRKSKSLTDQILDNLLLNLENQDGYSNDLIGRLRELADHSELTKSVKVASVLKTTQGGQNEAN